MVYTMGQMVLVSFKQISTHPGPCPANHSYLWAGLMLRQVCGLIFVNLMVNVLCRHSEEDLD